MLFNRLSRSSQIKHFALQIEPLPFVLQKQTRESRALIAGSAAGLDNSAVRSDALNLTVERIGFPRHSRTDQ
jgi:hypothetical protein